MRIWNPQCSFTDKSISGLLLEDVNLLLSEDHAKEVIFVFLKNFFHFSTVPPEKNRGSSNHMRREETLSIIQEEEIIVSLKRIPKPSYGSLNNGPRYIYAQILEIIFLYGKKDFVDC